MVIQESSDYRNYSRLSHQLKKRILCLRIFLSEIKCTKSKNAAPYLEAERQLDAIPLDQTHYLQLSSI